MIARRLDVRGNPLMHAAARRAIERGGVHLFDGHASLPRQSDGLLHATIGACRNAKPPHAPSAEGFNHGVKAVNQH
jgi:hypothetical protein